MFMANAGGAWDNAKKVVEVDLQGKRHASACCNRRRRHRGRSVQRHELRGIEPDHQVHDVVRLAGCRDRCLDGRCQVLSARSSSSSVCSSSGARSTECASALKGRLPFSVYNASRKAASAAFLFCLPLRAAEPILAISSIEMSPAREILAISSNRLVSFFSQSIFVQETGRA